MTSSKAKVLTDAELVAEATRLPHMNATPYMRLRFLATIDALKADVDDLTETNQDLRQSRDILEAELAQKNDKVKSLCDIVEKIEAELALKDKVVEAARWDYDLMKIGNDPVEVAFDGGLGMCNVQICQRYLKPIEGGRGLGSLDRFGYRPTEPREYIYRREGSDLDLSIGWRPYAWRTIQPPPPLNDLDKVMAR